MRPVNQYPDWQCTREHGQSPWMSAYERFALVFAGTSIGLAIGWFVWAPW